MRRNIESGMPLNRLLSGRGRILKMAMVGVSLSLVLTGCFDRPSPDVDWYLENPLDRSRVLWICHHRPFRLTEQACTNARGAHLKATEMAIAGLKERDRDAARRTPESQRTVDWYKQHKYALRDKLEECRDENRENQLSCLRAAQASRRLFVEGDVVYYR